MPAWIALPIPTPPPWCTLTHVAPAATLTRALRIGQSAIASDPSRIASVSRNGEATEPASRWSRPMTIGAFTAPLRTSSLIAGLTSQVVAIVENIRTASDVLEQPFDVRDDRCACTAQVLVRIGRAQCGRLVDRQALRDVAGQRIVRCGLVCDEIEVLAARRELGHDVRGVAEQADRQCTALGRGGA